MQESELYQRWFSLANSKKVLYSGDHQLQIMQAGELNQLRGPDICHARFKLDGQIYQGAVEFHLRPRDWYYHHHHLDKAYSDVLLHLVAYEDTDCAVKHQASATLIPTLLLPPSTPGSITGNPLNCPAFIELSWQEKRQLLGDLALQRFTMKTRQYSEELSVSNKDQVYFGATMRSLGYPNNNLAFTQLSQKINWNRIWQWMRQWGHDQQGIYALLAGMAGFLSTQRSTDPFVSTLQDRFEVIKYQIDSSPMDERNWVWAACRPGNHPHYRLAGFSDLLCHHQKPFWELAEEILMARKDYKHAVNQIKSLFQIPLHPYWKTHYALGQACSNPGRRHFFGVQRISEWLINVLLPVTAARAGLNDSHGFTEYLKFFYLQIPLREIYGQFKNSMVSYNLPSKMYIGQGLLQLSRRSCRVQGCKHCVINRSD